MKRFATLAMVLALALGVPAHAQEKPSAADEQAGRERFIQEAQAAEVAKRASRERERQDAIQAEKQGRVVPLDVEIVISRYQGDKKISSLPYALTVNAPYQYMGRLDAAPLTQLRMGGQVALPTTAPAVGPDGKPLNLGITGGGPVQYKEIGTSIDARGRWLDSPAGSFEVWISVQEDAVVTPQGASATTLPVIRTFRASNNLVLRDGQTRQFSAAADRITGEVVKVDVTLKVAK